MFALTQALELYDIYQAKVADCDVSPQSGPRLVESGERQADAFDDSHGHLVRRRVFVCLDHTAQ